MKKFRSLLLMALPLFALALSGCVKYNGRESSNPSAGASVVISQDSITLEEGKTSILTASCSRAVELMWESGNDEIVSLSSLTGSQVTVTAVKQGKTTVSAYVNYNSKKYSASCSVTVTRKGAVDPENPDKPDPSDPVTGETVTTYLVIGENGRYKGEPGKDIASLYLEYTVEFTAEVGTALPTNEDVTSTVTGSKFQYWQSYEGDGALTKWEKVPNARGKILYACFGGGDGSQPVTPEPEPEPQGTVTLYFAGINNWEDETVVNLGINAKFTAATKQANGNYKASIAVTGAIQSVNAYLNQGGQDGKYFHPTTGTVDYNRMNSAINTGDVKVELGKTYTITFIDWAYAEESWEHAWFSYSFTEGEPSEVTPGPTPVDTGKITLIFAGIEIWEDPTDVHFAINSNWKKAEKQNDGKYKVEFSFVTVTTLSCYMHQADAHKYFHPTKGDGTYDRFYSDVNMGEVTIEKDCTYVLTYTGWDNNHFETHDGDEHGWFTYSFAKLA